MGRGAGSVGADEGPGVREVELGGGVKGCSWGLVDEYNWFWGAGCVCGVARRLPLGIRHFLMSVRAFEACPGSRVLRVTGQSVAKSQPGRGAWAHAFGGVSSATKL